MHMDMPYFRYGRFVIIINYKQFICLYLLRERIKYKLPYIALFLAILGLLIYWRTGVEQIPGDINVRAGNYRLEDGLYDEAAKQF